MGMKPNWRPVSKPNRRESWFPPRKVEVGTVADKLKVISFKQLNHHAKEIYEVECTCCKVRGLMAKRTLVINELLDHTWYR